MVEVSTQQELQAELAKTKSATVLFYATWCGFCSRFKPVFEEWVDTQKGEAVIYVLLDDYDSPLWDEFTIPAAPCVIYFQDGKIQSRLDAKLGRGITVDAFQKWIAERKK
jgi:thioredoxin-like negative regulator of GroEL